MHPITDAPASLTVDQSRRARSYMLQMGVRVVCLVLACVVHGWLLWVCVAGAVVLPYVAVLVANGGRDRRATTVAAYDPRALPSAAETAVPGPADDAGTTAEAPDPTRTGRTTR